MGPRVRNQRWSLQRRVRGPRHVPGGLSCQAWEARLERRAVALGRRLAQGAGPSRGDRAVGWRWSLDDELKCGLSGGVVFSPLKVTCGPAPAPTSLQCVTVNLCSFLQAYACPPSQTQGSKGMGGEWISWGQGSFTLLHRHCHIHTVTDSYMASGTMKSGASLMGARNLTFFSLQRSSA